MDPPLDTPPRRERPPSVPGTVWKVPGLEVFASRSWGRVSAAAFARGGEEGVWRGEQHRLVVTPAGLRGRAVVQIEGGRTAEFVGNPTPVRDVLAFYPAGATVRVAHEPARHLQVLLDPALFREVGRELAGVADPAPVVPFLDPLVAEIMRALAREAAEGRDERLLVDGLATALAVQVARRVGGGTPLESCETALPRERLRRVLDHIEAHLGGDMSLAELAAVACLSPYHFSRCFKQAVGVGPRRYVLKRRVERAKELLRRTDEPLALMAHALGFADQSHFTSTFRRETGTTPSRFRVAVAS